MLRTSSWSKKMKGRAFPPGGGHGLRERYAPMPIGCEVLLDAANKKVMLLESPLNTILL